MTYLQANDKDVIALCQDIDRLIEAKEDNFKSLACAAGLDPAVDFRGANLRGLDLHDQDLRDFDLTHADLEGADLQNAYLECRKLYSANLNKTRMHGAILYCMNDGERRVFLSNHANVANEGVRFEKIYSELSDSPPLAFAVPVVNDVPVTGHKDRDAAELPLAAAVLALWPTSFPETFSRLRSALQSFDSIELAIRQLAHEMWKNSVSNQQDAWDFWLAAEKHVVVLTAAVISSAPSSAKAANALAPVLSVLSGATHLQLIERLAHSIWEQTGCQYGYALDHWLAAEKQVLAVTFAVVASSSDALGTIRNLMTALGSLDPAKVLEPIRAMAEAMWEQAGRQPGQALDFWVAAEKHVLTLTVAAIRQASAGSKPAEVVAETFTAFSPIRYLQTIGSMAERIWQEAGRQTSRTFDYWLNAERQQLSSIADGTETISAYIQ